MGPKESAWNSRQTEHFAPFVLLCLFVLLGALIFRPGIVNFDGSAHYAYLRSAVIDGDFDFSNDIVPAEWPPRTETGRVADFAPVGAAIAWAPWFAAAHGICEAVALPAGYCGGGFGWLYVSAISLGTAVYGLAGLMVVQRSLRHVADPGSAWTATISVWLASPLLVYMYVVPSMPHAIAFAAVSAFLACWWAARDRLTVFIWFAWGLVGGIAALVRWQSAIWLVLPCWTLLAARAPLAGRASAGAAFAGAFLLAFSPQMAAWIILFGKALIIPQGSGFLDWGRPAIAEVLFSPLHGLFAWMPLAWAAVAGLAGLAAARRDIGAPLLVVMALYVYVNAIAGDWWGGGAFGPRRFVDALPALMMGMSWLLGRARRRPRLFKSLVLVSILCIAGQWLFMAEFFSARVFPEQPLTWPDAVAQLAALGPAQWLILTTIPGQWHMGPYGTPVASAAYLLAFSLAGIVAWRVLSHGRWHMFSRATAALAVLAIGAIDVIIVSFR